MSTIDRDLDRALTLLRNKIREKGFTQLSVQEALGWGRSYISQLLTKQKSLRLEQVLMILSVIGVEAGDFFEELYGRNKAPASDRPAHDALGDHSAESPPADLALSLRELRALVQGVLRLLVDKNILAVDELVSAVRAAEEGPILAALEAE